MTHTLELPESVERVLERKAQRRGVALNVYLLDLAARDAANDEPRVLDKRGASFLALLDKARPIIAAGTLRPLTSESVNSALDAVRSGGDLGEYPNE